MTRWHRILFTALVFAIAMGVAVHKRSTRTPSVRELDPSARAGLRPRFLELGSKGCTQCKMMKKVVAALKREFPDSLQTDFVDVAIDVDEGKKYGIKMIPTQILFDADGKELFRHQGFISKNDVVAKFSELGHDLKETKPALDTASVDTVEDEPGLVANAFKSLSTALEGYASMALGAAFLWGVLSILLSPCHLASIPLIVGFINEQGKTMTTRRAFGLSSLFSIGILITIAIIGAVTAMAGRMWGDVGFVGTLSVATIFLVVGLHLMGVIPMPFNGPGQVKMGRRGMLAAFILGLVFGIALGPCTFAFMAPVLGLVFKLGENQPIYAATLLLVYGIGHCGVIALAGTFTEAVQKYMNWNGGSKAATRLKVVCGGLVTLGGFFLVWKTF